MDEVNWKKAMMQGHSFPNHDWFPRPKLEIPNIEPTTPRRQGTSSQSPRGIYDFPISPQSPREGMLFSPPTKPTHVKPIPRPMWIVEEDYIDLIPKCTQFSPKNNHTTHGFGDCNAQCNSNSSNTTNKNENFGYGSNLSPSLNIGDNVLVRCNKTKWLAGQVRRTSSDGIKIWIGAAETMVNVPIELFSTHLARIECSTPCSSPNNCYNSNLHQNHSQFVKTQVQCVRPAHLSHRRLFQVASPHNSNTNSLQQMNQSQCLRSTFTNPQMKYEGHCQGVAPMNASNPSNLFENIAHLEKKGTMPPKHPTLKQVCEPNSQEALFNGHGDFVHKQTQLHDWRLHMAQGNRSSYPSPSTLPMLNVNLCNESTPRLNSSSINGRNYTNYHHERASPHESQNQPYNINQETPTMHATSQEPTRSPLLKPDYKQFVAPQMVTKGTMTNPAETHIKSPRRPPTPSQLLTKSMTYLGEGKSPKKPPTPSPIKSKEIGEDAIQSLTKGMMDLGDGRSPKRPPTPSRSKGKETCEDQTCPSWAKGTDFRQISESHQGMSLERSVSLDSFQPPSFPGLVDARPPGARPPRNATSTEPVWVTVIDNGNGTRKST